MKNSCNGKRGCELTLVLPYGGRDNRFISRVVQKRYVSKKVLSFSNAALYQMAQTKRQMEARIPKADGDLCLLPNVGSTSHYSADNERGGFVNAHEYRGNIFNY